MKGLGSGINLPQLQAPLPPLRWCLSPSSARPISSFNFLIYSCKPHNSPPMLRLFSSSTSRIHRATAAAPPRLLRANDDSSNSVLRTLSRFAGLGRRDSRTSGFRVFFCSDSSDGSGSESVVDAEAKAAESEPDVPDSKSSSAIMPTNPRPEDYLTVRMFSFSSSPNRKRLLLGSFHAPLLVSNGSNRLDCKLVFSNDPFYV